MMDEQPLRARYQDMLDDTADPALLHFIEQLDTDLNRVYTVADPPPRLVTAISNTAQRHHVRATTRFMWHWSHPLRWVPRHLRGAAAALLVVLCLAGAGYAMLPVLEEAFGLHTGTEAIVTNNLGREVDLSHTVDGFTVAVERVYADANQIVIGYTITGPAGRTFNHILAWGDLNKTPGQEVARSPILTDAAGNEFSGGLGGAQPGIQDGRIAAALLTYNGVGVDSTATEIRVHLKIGELSAYERIGDDVFEDVTVNGPFEFDLDVPVEPGRVANLHQRSEVDGTAVTLERVVTTPTGTRVSVRGAGPNADVQLRVGGATYPLHPPDGMATPSQWSPDSAWEYITGTSLQDQHGPWELVVTAGPAVPIQVDPAGTSVPGGPWIFQFVVP